VLEGLKSIDVDALSPLEAVRKLYEFGKKWAVAYRQTQKSAYNKSNSPQLKIGLASARPRSLG
jgi:hypothetical protein